MNQYITGTIIKELREKSNLTQAELAVERGCGRLEWSCLDWNKPSIDFYLFLGCTAYVRLDSIQNGRRYA